MAQLKILRAQTMSASAAPLDSKALEIQLATAQKKKAKLKADYEAAQKKVLEVRLEMDDLERQHTRSVQRSSQFKALFDKQQPLQKEFKLATEQNVAFSKAALSFFHEFETLFGSLPLTRDNACFTCDGDYEEYVFLYFYYNKFALPHFDYRKKLVEDSQIASEAASTLPLKIKYEESRHKVYIAAIQDCNLFVVYANNNCDYLKSKKVKASDQKSFVAGISATAASVDVKATKEKALKLEIKKNALKAQTAALELRVARLKREYEAIPQENYKVHDPKRNRIYDDLLVMPAMKGERYFIDFFERTFGINFLNKNAVKPNGERFFLRNSEYDAYISTYHTYNTFRFESIMSHANKQYAPTGMEKTDDDKIICFNNRINFYEIANDELNRQEIFYSGLIQYERELEAQNKLALEENRRRIEAERNAHAADAKVEKVLKPSEAQRAIDRAKSAAAASAPQAPQHATSRHLLLPGNFPGGPNPHDTPSSPVQSAACPPPPPQKPRTLAPPK